MGSVTLEEWRDVIGFEGLYQVSSLGRVKSVERRIKVNGSQQACKTIKERICFQKQNRPTGRGYVRYLVSLYKSNKQTTRNVARLVAEAFIPNPLGLPCVLHLDDNALNNRVENLEWGTPQENSRQAAERGRLRYGQEHHASSLSDVDRRNAYEMLASGLPVSEVATRLSAPFGAICDLKHGRIKGYGKVETPRLFVHGSSAGNVKLTEDQVLEIKRMLTAGERQADIATRFGVAKSTIAAINHGANWAWLTLS